MDIIKAAYAFEYDGNPVACQEFGSGHINSTYKVCTDDGKTYVLQHINKYVFKSPLKVMENTGAVTSYLAEHTDGKCSVMHFLTTKTLHAQALTSVVVDILGGTASFHM